MAEAPATGTTGAVAAATGPVDWKAGLPEDLRASPALKDVKDVGSLAKGYLEAQGALGRSLRLPSKEAGDADRKAFRQKVLELGKDYGVIALPGEGEDATPFFSAVGRPAKPEEYETPDTKASGVEFDQAEANQFKAIAHAAGLSKKQFNKIINDMAATRVASVTAQRAASEAATGELKAEWGEAFDQRIADTTRRLELHGAPPALLQAWKGGKVDAGSARWLHSIMEAFGDEPSELQRQGKRVNGNVIAPDEAMERVAEIEKRLQTMNPSDPDYQALVNRRVQLIERAYAGRT